MRILALRGANLASLTAFDIDLTREPLAGAGLFAITGDTGAGKSTLLDALCLALFGDYPRAAIGRNEKVIDPSGETHSVQDARNVLRRGAASGFAEVDFIGRDGHGYRARWDARRAKGKVDGKLQKETRTLNRLDDRSAVATGTRDVLAAVEHRTGLTFDQFRRTVLLAQGEFDAFLLADEKARAELLEKITGTEVYRKISQAIALEASQRSLAVRALEDRAGALDLLGPEPRAALERSCSQAAEALSRLRGEIAVLVAERALAERQAEARRRFADAEVARSAAVAADAAGQADRDRLALLSRLAPLDDKATDMRVADKAATVAEAAHAACEQDAAAAARSSMDAARALQRAMQADTQAAADLAVLEPIWREADAIDRELAAAETALTESRRQAAGAAEAVRKSEVMLTTLIAEAAGCQRERDKLATDFTSDSIQSRFAERAAEVEDLFERRLVLAGAKSAALAEARHSEADLVKLVQAADTDQARLTELKAAQADIAAELENVRARWRDADAGRIEVRARAVDAIQGVVDEVLELANGWVEAGDEIATATDIIDATDDRLTQAEARRRHADTELDRATAARREVGHLADLAAATASEAAGGLRAHLRPGQPCPVCGGSDHPYAHNADASVRIVATMLGRRDALDQQIDTLTQSVAEARGELAAATVERDDAVRRRTEALEIQDGIVALFPEKRETLEAALAEHAWEHALPFQLDAAMPAEVLALADKVQLVRNEVMHARDEIAELRMALDELQAQADAIAAEREALAQRVEQSSARRQTAERFRLVADNKVQQANAALAVLTLSLTPYLEGAQLSVLELDRDPAGVRARFKALTAAHAASRVKLGELDKRLQELAVQIAKASAERDNAIGLASTVSTRVVESESLAVQRRSDRAKLLDGMPTAEHRARHLAAREAAQKARVEADAAQRDSALEHVRHIERTLASRAVLDAAIAQRNEARARFTQALAAAGIADPQALDVVRLSPDAVASLEAAVASKARAAADATTTLALRQTDLSAALAAGQVERADAEIAKQVAERETQVIELEAARARAVARLTLDDETRRKAGALTADIEAAKAELDTWSAVDEAIGSASGDKFCRFAQGITLDHLVRLANGQLDLIAPRYRLTRMDAGDLALAVIDRDMGDEVRGVRSLSGGERFLVSLALALALSGLEGRQAFVDTLFIDEGFGALDAETLETAVAALEALHGQGRRVGVVTHVAAMIDRIAVQIRVEKRGQGRSEVRLRDGTSLARAA